MAAENKQPETRQLPWWEDSSAVIKIITAIGTIILACLGKLGVQPAVIVLLALAGIAVASSNGSGLGGGKKLLSLLLVTGALGLGLGGCGRVAPVPMAFVSDPAVCAVRSIYQGQPDHTLQTARVLGDGLCSGALVASDAVLTAKHCGDARSVEVWGATYGVLEVIQCDDADLEILRLDDHAAYWTGDNIEPLTIYVGELAVGSKVHISGYGKRHDLGEPTDYPTGGDQRIAAIDDGSIYLDGSPGVCDGDSGGPALYGSCLIGVHRARLVECGERSIITRLAKYAGWLQEVVK